MRKRKKAPECFTGALAGLEAQLALVLMALWLGRRSGRSQMHINRIESHVAQLSSLATLPFPHSTQLPSTKQMIVALTKLLPDLIRFCEDAVEILARVQVERSIAVVGRLLRERFEQMNDEQVIYDELIAMDVQLNLMKEEVDIAQLGSVLELGDNLCAQNGYNGQLVHVRIIPERHAIYEDIERGSIGLVLEAALKSAFGVNHIKWYSHQAKAIQHILAGRHVAVSTSTSSGKSILCYVPFLESVIRSPSNQRVRALFLYPTKALAQDQLRSIRELCNHLPVGTLPRDDPQFCATLDGDTPLKDRRTILRCTSIILTNPDMLHTTLLPTHDQSCVASMFKDLKLVVIDEAHVYCGVFGSHVANVLRRLRLVCLHHRLGHNPLQFVGLSATIGNAREHMEALTGCTPFELIDVDGSPNGKRLLAIWNPPLKSASASSMFKRPQIDPTERDPFAIVEEGMLYEDEIDRKSLQPTKVKRQSDRASSIYEMGKLVAYLVQSGKRTIAFCRSRKLCELVLKYSQQLLRRMARETGQMDCSTLVKSYRGGYSLEERRIIELELFSGELLAVVCTNALELGIDVGTLDVTLHLGFPNSMSSFWQQAGRAGRRGREAATILIAFDSPVDQFLVKQPNLLFELNAHERIFIDNHNDVILRQHLVCASFEIPLTSLSLDVLEAEDLSRLATSRRWLCAGPNGLALGARWIDGMREDVDPMDDSPARLVSLRDIDEKSYQVQVSATGQQIDELPAERALFDLFPGSILLLQGQNYNVTNVDFKERIAQVEALENCTYYTQCRDQTDVHVLQRVSHSKIVSNAFTGACKVVTRIYGYRRMQVRDNSILETIDLEMPEICLLTTAMWIDASTVVPLLGGTFLNRRAAFHAASHALINAVPLLIRGNSRVELSTECVSPHESSRRQRSPRLLLYENRSGGTGISNELIVVLPELIKAAQQLVEACTCLDGCLYCIHSVSPSSRCILCAH